MKVIYIVIFLLHFLSFCSAQDPNYRQIYNTRLLNNPAYAGIDEGLFRLNMVHRKLYMVIPGPFESNSINFDLGFCRPTPFGVGVVFKNEMQGDGFLTTNQVEIPFAIHIPISDYSSLSCGIGLGIVQQSTDWNKYTFPDQIDYRGKIPNKPSLNSDDYLNSGSIKPNLSAGLVFRTRFLKSNPKVNAYKAMSIGLYGNNLIKPAIGLTNDYNLPRLFGLCLGYLNQPRKNTKPTFLVYGKWVEQDNLNFQNIQLASEVNYKSMIGGISLSPNIGGFINKNTHYLVLTMGYEAEAKASFTKICLSYDINISGASGKSSGNFELNIVFTRKKINGCGTKPRGPCDWDRLGIQPIF